MKNFQFGNFNFTLIKKDKNLLVFSFSGEDIIKEVSPVDGSLISIIYNDSILLKNHIIKITKNNYLYFVSKINEDFNPITVSVKKKKFEFYIIKKLARKQRNLLKSYASLIKDNYSSCEVGSDLDILNQPEIEYSREDYAPYPVFRERGSGGSSCLYFPPEIRPEGEEIPISHPIASERRGASDYLGSMERVLSQSSPPINWNFNLDSSSFITGMMNSQVATPLPQIIINSRGEVVVDTETSAPLSPF